MAHRVETDTGKAVMPNPSFMGDPGTMDRDDDKKIGAVYAKLKDLLVNYRFRPDEHLQITELADRLRVSITPVREAMTRLYGEALVKSTPNRGFFAKTLSVEEMSALYELAFLILRHAIEKNAGGFDLVNLLRPSDPQMVLGSYSGERAAETHKARARYIEHLFERIAALSANDAMIDIIKNFNDRTHYIRMIDLETEINDQIIATDMLAFIAALERRDMSEAVSNLERQFTKKLDRMPALVKEGLVRNYISSIPAKRRG